MIFSHFTIHILDFFWIKKKLDVDQNGALTQIQVVIQILKFHICKMQDDPQSYNQCAFAPDFYFELSQISEIAVMLKKSLF